MKQILEKSRDLLESRTHFALRVCLAGFDDLGAAASVQLKAVRLALIGDFALADLEATESRLVAANEIERVASLTEMFSSGMMPRGSLSVVYSK